MLHKKYIALLIYFYSPRRLCDSQSSSSGQQNYLLLFAECNISGNDNELEFFLVVVVVVGFTFDLM